MNNEQITYKDAGVDISKTDALKKNMRNILDTNDDRVLNKIGAFAALYDIGFDISNPVLVLKSEEPGSKQKLAFEYGFVESICHDMINHLVNDIIVMGARPLAVLDTIVTSKTDTDQITELVTGMRNACNDNECVLIGGETSIQPGIVSDNTCVLTSSIAGIISKDQVIDGSNIKVGDKIIAISSNGIHTNGYTLIRMLMEKYPEILEEKINGKSFIDTIMIPHRAYYQCIKEGLKLENGITGMAHITGGGIEGNICRIIPNNCKAKINLNTIQILDIFKLIRKYSNASDEEMLSTFNCGVGMIVICNPNMGSKLLNILNKYFHSYEIGEIVESNLEKVEFENKLMW